MCARAASSAVAGTSVPPGRAGPCHGADVRALGGLVGAPGAAPDRDVEAVRRAAAGDRVLAQRAHVVGRDVLPCGRRDPV
jgi:hypothetical protein